MIYKPAAVTPVGLAQNYQTSTAVYDPLYDRPPLAQTFTVAATGETFTVMGTVDQPEMWSYVIEIGYLGPSVFEIAGPVAWETVRAPDPQQSAPEEPIQNDVLAEGVPLGSTRTGYYAVRLRILPIEGPAPEPCDVVVQH